jgi:leucyl aminopeptidase
MASGLDKHGIGSEKPLPYAHCDIAGSSGFPPDLPTATPLLTFAFKYVVPRII